MAMINAVVVNENLGDNFLTDLLSLDEFMILIDVNSCNFDGLKLSCPEVLTFFYPITPSSNTSLRFYK